MSTGPKREYRCQLCTIDFNSSIPYEMHLRGSKHAKKVKTYNASKTFEQTANTAQGIGLIGNVFRCDMCSVLANSAGQLQTHLDGTKHKTKLEQQRIQEAKERGEIIEPNAETNAAVPKTEVNGKTNGGTVRPLPADFDNPQPTKISKYMCHTCQVHMNSETQLQQHMVSKKHQAKVEGKPIIKKKKPETNEDGSAAQAMEVENANPVAADGSKTSVVGVKTLATCFVQGGTLK